MHCGLGRVPHQLGPAPLPPAARPCTLQLGAVVFTPLLTQALLGTLVPVDAMALLVSTLQVGQPSSVVYAGGEAKRIGLGGGQLRSTRGVDVRSFDGLHARRPSRGQCGGLDVHTQATSTQAHAVHVRNRSAGSRSSSWLWRVRTCRWCCCQWCWGQPSTAPSRSRQVPARLIVLKCNSQRA